jgi:transposase InsO family protein
MLCEVVDLPASTYYYQSNKSDELDLRAALEAIAVQHPRYGSRRLTEELKRAGWQINRKRVQRLMQEENLLVQVRR